MLSDEVTQRESTSTERRANPAGLDPTMQIGALTRLSCGAMGFRIGGVFDGDSWSSYLEHVARFSIFAAISRFLVPIAGRELVR